MKLFHSPPYHVYMAVADIGVAPGSALVSLPAPNAATVECYFEGNIYNASNVRTFERKAFHAADRLATHYPTVTRGSFHLTDLRLVGQLVSEEVTLTRMPEDLHLELSVPDEVISAELARMGAAVRARYPDFEVLWGHRARKRFAYLTKAVPNISIERCCVFAASAATDSNPVGFLGGGDCRESAFANVLLVGSR